MKIVSVIYNGKIPNWCPRLRPPYMALPNNCRIIGKSISTNNNPITNIRTDKILNVPYFDKSVSFRDVIDLTKEAVESKKKMDAILRKCLSKYVADDNNPDRPIREIKGRIKTPESTMEKVQGFIQNSPGLAPKLRTKAGIKDEIKDLIGNKIVLRSDDKKDTATILKELFKANKNGDLNITEVEIYYPTLKGKEEDFVQFMQTQYGKKISRKECEKIIGDKDYFSYVARNEIDKLAEKYGIEVKYPPRNTGYTAIHVSTISPDGFKGEIQIVGCNVEKLSNVEHQYYKAKCGKKVDPALKAAFEPIMPQSENTEIKDLTQDYTFFAYIFERLKAKIHYKQKIDTEFLRAPKRLLDLQLGFNQNAPIIRGHWARNKNIDWKMYTIPQ